MKKREGIISYLYELLYLLMAGIGIFKFLWPYLREISPEETLGLSFKTERMARFSESLIFALMVLLIILIIYGLVKLLTISLWTKIVLFIILLGSQLFMIFSKTVVDKVVTDSIYALMIILVTDIIQYFWKKEGDINVREHVVFLFPLYVIFFTLLVVLPAPDEKADWSTAKRIYHTVVDEGKKLIARFESFGADGFGEGNAGFGEIAKVLGEVGDNKKEVLTIKSGALKDGPIYLGGKTFNRFNGHEWTQEALGFENEEALNSAEFISGVSSSYDDPITDIYKAEKVEITFKNVKTKYLFAPAPLLFEGRVLDKKSSDGISFISEDLEWKKGKGYGTTYELKFLVLNQNASKAAENIKDIKKVEWISACNKSGYTELGGRDISILPKHRQYVYDTYLDDIEVSLEIQNMVDLIVGDAENDYEKLERIAAYLRMGEYNTAPGLFEDEISSGGEFLEAFLMGKTSGYCVHYATAFVLMARMEGIPARYVQGYCVPKNGSGEAIVSGNNSHAWPEAYIDNLGWLSFEPTPGFYTPVSWETAAMKKERYQNDKAAHDEAWEEYLKAQEELKEQLASENESGEEEQEKQGVNGYAVLAIFLVSAVIVSAAILVSVVVIKNRRFKLLEGKNKVIAMNKRSLLMLDCIGYSMQPGETLREYEKRLSDMYSKDYTGFMEEYELLLYGNDTYSENMLMTSENCMNQLKRVVKKEKKLTTYFFRQYYT